MPNSFYKVAIHVVFSTKNRELLISPKVENVLYPFIIKEIKKMDCKFLAINGASDHLHLLFLQNPKIAITDTIKQIKGASSYMINQEGITEQKFAWQNGYGVFSISDSHIDRLINYIKNQKAHHRSITLEMELMKLKSV